MTLRIGTFADDLLSRSSLGRLLRNQRIDVETSLDGHDTPFARTSVLWSGNATLQICARRCGPADDCACGLTGDPARWPSMLRAHQRDLDGQAVSAFRQARRLSRRLKLWVPVVTGASILITQSLQGSLLAAISWSVATTLGVSALARLGLMLAERWLFRRALSQGFLPQAR